MKRFGIAVLSLCGSLVSGCASSGSAVVKCTHAQDQPKVVSEKLKPYDLPDQIKQIEKRLGTRLDYHLLATNPDELVVGLEGAKRHGALSLDLPVYFLGIEKPRRDVADHVRGCIGRDYDFGGLKTLNAKAYKAACQAMNDGRPMLLTHIVRFDGIRSGEFQGPCNIYNVYRVDSPCARSLSAVDRERYTYDDAIRAMDALRTEIRAATKEARATHILIMSTGWNTQQDESLYNYLDWLDGVSKAATTSGVPFRPLVLAITWESKWERVPTWLSAVTKGNDADEIGLTWANRLLHDVVLPSAQINKVPVVMIGHSYGARVLGTALYRSDVIKPEVARKAQSPKTFISLQSAFPILRFDPAEGAEPLFATQSQPVTVTVMTASRSDLATGLLKDSGKYAGGGPGIDAVRDGEAPRFIHPLSADSNGRIDLPAPTLSPGVYLVDSSELVNCQMPQTGGGAHSDVFDAEIGRLMWQVINASK